MKCDIIVPIWNELDITKRCIESILENTKFAYHLIIIDNASKPDVRTYLEGIKRKIPDLSLIRNEENLGYVKAINQGLRLADSEFVCLLNNDTIVTDGWLREMVALADNNPEIGIINPSSNNLIKKINPASCFINC